MNLPAPIPHDPPASWHTDLTWHDVEVGDRVRLHYHWRTITRITTMRFRPGTLAVFIDPPLAGGHHMVWADPTDTVTVQFPRTVEQTGRVA